MHQLEYYREGSTPDALIELPKEWNPDQIADFQKHFDAMLAGSLGLRRHARFMPGDFKYQETKAPPLKDAYDEFLARIICFVFSVSPEPFVGQVNRATAQTSHARATDEGLGPLMRYVRAFLNRIIATEFASPDLEFAWEETRAQDPAQAAQIDVAYVGAGILTVDEVRANLGLDPLSKPTTTLPPAQKYNRNHLGPGPNGGQFTEASRNGTSNGLPPGAGTPQRSEIVTPSQAAARGVQVAQIPPVIGILGEIGRVGGGSVSDIIKPGIAETETLRPVAPTEEAIPSEEIAGEKVSTTDSNEVSRLIDKASKTTGNDGEVVSDKAIAEKAAKDFVGENAEQIYNRQTGEPVGEISANGLRVARYTSAKDPDDAYINLINKETGGNLHVRC